MRGLRAGLAAGLVAVPARVAAHAPEGGDTWLSIDPWLQAPLAVVLLLAVAGMVRARGARGAPRAGRVLAFAGLVAALAAALVWPFDVLGEERFSAHMMQHMLLLAVVPPLCVAARIGPAALRALPAASRAALVRPLRWPVVRGASAALRSLAVTTVLHAAVLWAWHVPVLFEAALESPAVHRLEHLCFVLAGLLWWRALAAAHGGRTPAAVLALFVTVIHSGMLGALLTFAPEPLYPLYLDRAHDDLDVLADQQLAGLLMWVPMAAVYGGSAVARVRRMVGDPPGTGARRAAPAGAVAPVPGTVRPATGGGRDRSAR